MRPTLERTSIERSRSCGSLHAAATCCPRSALKKSGLKPLAKRPLAPRSRVVRVHSGLLETMQAQVGSLVERLSDSKAFGTSPAARAVQAALLATATFVQKVLTQVLLAAMAMHHVAALEEQQQQAAAAAAAAGEGGPAAQPQQLRSPLEAFAAATSGAVERLRHTLTDASSTLETKWSAMEATVGGAMGGLFIATSKSAEALNKLGPEPASSRAWQEQATKEVVAHEQAVYEQVFMQVYGELLSKDNRQISYNTAL